MKDRSRAVRRWRNAAAIIGVAGALIAGGVGTARASQGAPGIARASQGAPCPEATGIARAWQWATLVPCQTESFSTWFLGGTTATLTAAPSPDGSYQEASFHWSAGPANGGGNVSDDGNPTYINGAFLGFPLVLKNDGPGTIYVTFFPGGP